MAIGREALSIVQFLRVIDRDRIGQSQLSYTMNPQFSPARGRALNNMAADMEVTGLN